MTGAAAPTFAQLSDQRDRLRRQLAWTIERRRYAVVGVGEFDKWIRRLEQAIRELDLVLAGPAADSKPS